MSIKSKRRELTKTLEAIDKMAKGETEYNATEWNKLVAKQYALNKEIAELRKKES